VDLGFGFMITILAPMIKMVKIVNWSKSLKLEAGKQLRMVGLDYRYLVRVKESAMVCILLSASMQLKVVCEGIP
jgi:hypothetical protein